MQNLTNAGDPPEWALNAIESVRDTLMDDTDYADMHDLELEVENWTPNGDHVWVSTSLVDDDSKLAALRGLFQAEASVGKTRVNDKGIYLIELLD